LDIAEEPQALSAKDLALFALFCERALAIGNLLSSINVQDIASGETLADLGGDVGQSLVVLMEQGYLHRSGYRQYAVTPVGFEMYALSSIEGYEERQNAVKDAVAAVEQTDTDSVIASTGESRQLVNHVLRLLQRRRDIGGFVTPSASYCVTRVSPAFKRERAERQGAA
jgi:hypothetical protein